MTGKVQMLILSAALMASGAGAQRAAEAVANNARVLRLAAQYKLFTGDTVSAARLLRKAGGGSVTAPAQASRGERTSCTFGHRA